MENYFDKQSNVQTKKEYKTLICGATFTGLGIANAIGSDCIVIERTAAVGREFINSYNAGKGWNEVSLSDKGTALQKELIRHNLLNEEGRVHLAGMAPVLFNRILQENFPCLFLTEILDIKQGNDGWEVTIYNASGIQKIKVQEIIDTTANKITCPKEEIKIVAKKLNILLNRNDFRGNDSNDVLSENEIAFVPGFFETEAVLKVDLEVKDDWPAARKKAHDFWKKMSPHFTDWKFAWLADEFEVQVKVEEQDQGNKITWLPSCNFSNPLEAFEKGYAFRAELEVK